MRPALLDHVSRPVPAIGRFQYHLGMLTGLGQLGRQGDRVVVDADRVERLACLVAPHDHAASPVQVDADILWLLFHGSLLLSFPGWFRNPKCALHTWSRATGGLPRALRLCSVGLRDAPRCHGDRSSCSAFEPGALTGARHAGAALRSFITSLTTPGPRPGSTMRPRISQASNAFYGSLFGWKADDQGEEMGHYTLMRKGGKTVAGNMKVMTEDQPSAWVTYVSVDNADATVDLAKKAGAMVFVEPMDVSDIGRMAVFADPGGAVIGVWQPKTFTGAELANEAGAFAWNELNTRDLPAAKGVLHRGVRVGTQRSRHGGNELHRVEARRQDGGGHDDRCPTWSPPRFRPTGSSTSALTTPTPRSPRRPSSEQPRSFHRPTFLRGALQCCLIQTVRHLP